MRSKDVVQELVECSQSNLDRLKDLAERLEKNGDDLDEQSTKPTIGDTHGTASAQCSL